MSKKVVSICPNCLRLVPNKKHFVKYGCKWCVRQVKKVNK